MFDQAAQRIIAYRMQYGAAIKTRHFLYRATKENACPGNNHLLPGQAFLTGCPCAPRDHSRA